MTEEQSAAVRSARDEVADVGAHVTAVQHVLTIGENDGGGAAIANTLACVDLCLGVLRDRLQAVEVNLGRVVTA